MKAQVFFIESQKKCCDRIEELLRKHIYKDIDVESVMIDQDEYGKWSGEGYDKCKRYLQLLKASILRIQDFDVVVRDDHWSTWCYLGYYSVKSGAYLELTHSKMPALFPAVAILDRMVMVPEGITTGLDKYPREFLWCPKPLDLGGVVLVDFNDDYSIEKAIKLVEVRLKSEIKKLYNRQMVAKHIKSPNLEELVKLIHIEKSYLKKLKDDSVFTTAQLSPAIMSGQAVIGELSEVTLVIQNQSEKPLDQVRVRVRAPVDILRKPVSEIIDLLPAHEAVTIKFHVLPKPKASPYCPLEVIVDMVVENTEDLQLFPIPVILEVKDKG